MGQAVAVVARRRWTLRSFVPVLAPAVIGVLFAAWGHPTRALLLWVAGGVVLLLVLLGVPVERYVSKFAVAVAHAVGVMATGLVGMLLIAGGLIARMFRHDPLVPRRARANQWHRAARPESVRALSARPFGVEPSRAGRVEEATGGLRILGRSALLSVGLVVVAVTADLTIGLGWERFAGNSPEDAARIVDAMNFTGNSETVEDVRASHPAMAAYPWADAYFRETQLTPSTYWPFTESRPLKFDGQFINIDGWSRRTYEPDSLPDDAPVVWMFGGSTTWGEGQRDEHTIASYLARIADEQGTAIRVVNYGQRGWTHFQEMILFEQLLAEGPPPDAAIFYDGANEINAQTLGVRGVPTHTLAAQYAERLAGGFADEVRTVDAPQSSPFQEIWATYQEHSAMRKGVRFLRRQLDPPAGASVPDKVVQQAEDEAEDFGQTYVKTLDDARAAVDVYQRGVALTELLASSYDVEPHFFWQPVVVGPAEEWANENMTEPTIDISDALDGRQDVFIDGGHTNEEGARLVAERIWAEIGGELAERAGGTSAPPPSGQAATTTSLPRPSTQAEIDSARAQLELSVGDPCAQAAWLPQLGVLRASSENESQQIAALVQRYFSLLADSSGPEFASQALRLREISAQVPDLIGTVALDPDQPLLVQFAAPTSPIPDVADIVTTLAAANQRSLACP